MKVFVTGVNGQVGHDVLLALQKRGHFAIGSGSGSAYLPQDQGRLCPYESLDITDASAVNNTLLRLRPDVIIHCSAWTAVDSAEDKANLARVYALNVTGAENMARAAQTIGAKMFYLSTDYVFNGLGEEAWKTDTIDFAPLNYYGQTKLWGEQAVAKYCDKHFIVRTSWVFGGNGSNFVKTMIRVGRNHSSVRVVNDQIGRPTYAYDLAELLCDMAERDGYGIYHATNEGEYISWYDFCVEIYRQAGLTTHVIPVSTQEYGLSQAKRPANSRLDTCKLGVMGFSPLPHWKNAVERFLQEGNA